MKKVLLRLAASLPLLLPPVALADPAMRDQAYPFLRLPEELQAFVPEQATSSPAFRSYLRFYGLLRPNTHYSAGFIPFGRERLFVNLMRPEAPRGTVVLLHGYFVHGGLQRYLIQDLLAQHWAVLAVDLPGHGLSSGPQASIENFSDYARALEQITQFTAGTLPTPLALIGHSTGGAAVWEYLLRNPENPYQNAILAAPLVRSYLWDLSRVGFTLGYPVVKTLPRVIRSTTHDESFMAFVKQDPLQTFVTPLRWVEALIDWNDRVIETYPPSPMPVLLLQGSGDSVVEWSTNIAFLKRKFSALEVREIEGAAHDLFWELPVYREQVFVSIREHLNAGDQAKQTSLK